MSSSGVELLLILRQEPNKHWGRRTMSKKEELFFRNLENLDPWVNIQEAAKRISEKCGKDIPEGKILQWVGNGHLKLFVLFQSDAWGRPCEIVPIEKTEWSKYPEDDLSEWFCLARDSGASIRCMLEDEREPFKECVIPINGTNALRFKDIILRIGELCDIPVFEVDKKNLLIQGGNFENRIGCFVKDGEDNLYLLYQPTDENAYAPVSEQIEFQLNPDEFTPATFDDYDYQYVVSTDALNDFMDLMSHSKSEETKSLDPRLETTYLNMIAVMLELLTGKHGRKHFISESQLRDFIEEKYGDHPGLTTGTLAKKFKQAKVFFKSQ